MNNRGLSITWLLGFGPSLHLRAGAPSLGTQKHGGHVRLGDCPENESASVG